MGSDAIEIEVAMGFFSNLFSKSKTGDISHAVVVETKPNPDELRTSKYQQLKRTGNEFLNLGQLEEASKAYKAALDENLQSSEAHLNFGYVLNELKRTDEAKIHFDRAEELDPQNFDAHFLRAMLAVDEDDTDKALLSIRKAMNINSESPEATSTLYKILAIRGEFHEIENHIKRSSIPDESSAKVPVMTGSILANMSCHDDLKKILNKKALAYFKKAIEVDPFYTGALTNQGLLLLSMENYDEAIKSFSSAIEINPLSAEAYYYIGITYKTTGDFKLGIENLEKSASLNPKHSDSHTMLADIHSQLGFFEKSIEEYKIAIAINPQSLDSHMRLSGVLSEILSHKEAENSANIAVNLRGDIPEVYYALGNVFFAQSKFSEAIVNYQKALQLRPSYEDVKSNLGGALLGIGNNIEARQIYLSLIKNNPNNTAAHGNLVYCSSFDPECSTASYVKHARAFGALVSQSAKPYTSWPRTELSNRRLKVGLVSGDFCFHPVGFFLESVIAFLDTDNIEIHAFSNRTREDELQTSLKSRVSTWTSIAGLSDEAAAKLIYDMQLDLLIDLSGHTNHHRLALFAWRPAPVQATWLGYWGSTGVTEIDYILTDRHAVPPDHHHHFTEQVWYVPDTRLCFTPPSAVYKLAPEPAPSSKLGYVTFGCYQPIRKLTDHVLALWGQIYTQLPDARFRLQGAGFTTPAISAELIQRLERAGVPRHSIILKESTKRFDYLKSHAEVDILLDSFPYPGGTTTCDALWMGVPTVTLAGNTMLSRQGLSLLMCAGLQDWVAQSAEEYVAIAVRKAQDLQQLNRQRTALRQQVFDSPLFDAPRFARNLEISLRAMVQDKQNRPQ